jgi:hypothetical protein
MLYPDDFDRLSALSEKVSQWVRRWIYRRWHHLPG